MHLKAIEIKEKMLGDDDYEVALSVGHLASLYNYDMEKYTEAEQLYHKSIAIGKGWFGTKRNNIWVHSRACPYYLGRKFLVTWDNPLSTPVMDNRDCSLNKECSTEDSNPLMFSRADERVNSGSCPLCYWCVYR